MTGHILVAPEYRELRGALIFLVGPIQGAPDWQADATRIIRRINKSIHIASPRRATESYGKGDFDSALYAQQVDWETHYIGRSAMDGCPLIWCAREIVHDCKRAYAQTTRGEMFERKLRHQLCGEPFALGIEPGFSGEKYIRRRFGQDCPDVPIRSTLEETCRDAVRVALGRGA